MLRPHAALRRFPGFLMFWIGQRTASRFAQALAPTGLHPRDFGLLNVLQHETRASQLELGRILGIDPSSMVGLLDDLEARGLVERHRNPVDRRAYQLRLTDDGTAMLERGRRIAGRLQRELLAGLDPAEREELVRLLAKVADDLDREPKPADRAT
jgi:DNA-binding MarR family transcriptional regulator